MKARWPLAQRRDVTSLVAVSGGADSVALLRLLREQPAEAEDQGQIIVAHFNHGWRGEESDDDEKFVRSLAEQLGLQFECGTPGFGQSGSTTEAQARSDRYDFLLKLAHRFGARYIAMGHTADDQAETILHRIIRGTGIRGLRGIPPLRSLSESVTVVRPLIDTTRAEIVEVLETIEQPFRNDSSNQDCNYTRNRIRHQLLPAIERDYNGDVHKSLIRLGQIASEAHTEIENQIEQIASLAVIDSTPTKVTVLRSEVEPHTSFMQQELFRWIWQAQGWPLQDMGHEQWQLFTRLKNDTTKSHANLPGNIQVVIDEKFIRLNVL